MNNFQIRKAERKSVRPSIGLFGPSGSGKTMSALRLAFGIVGDWSKIVVIDTENGSSELYAGYQNGKVEIGQFNVIPLTPPFTPERYIEAIDAAEKAGMEAIVIDSISHEWDGKGGILEMIEEMSNGAKNSFAVWGKMTPRHNAFIERIIRAHAYTICCGRSKQDYVIEQQERNGKTINVPKKIGLKAVTREGFDYELTVAFDVAISHYSSTSKDRTGVFSVKPEHILTEEDGQIIKHWVETGAPDPEEAKRQEAIGMVRGLIKELNSSEEVVEGIAGIPINSMNIVQLRKVYADLDATKKRRQAEHKRQEQEEGRATAEEEAKMSQSSKVAAVTPSRGAEDEIPVIEPNVEDGRDVNTNPSAKSI